MAARLGPGFCSRISLAGMFLFGGGEMSLDNVLGSLRRDIATDQRLRTVSEDARIEVFVVG